jgi:phage gpG-like protein
VPFGYVVLVSLLSKTKIGIIMDIHNRKTLKELQKKIAEVEGLAKRVPDIAAIEAVKLFQENFVKQGWQGASFRAWERKKTPNEYPILRSANQNSLMSSIHVVSKSPTAVVIATGDNKPYAKVHNEGGVNNVRVTDKLRKWAWAMWYKTNNDFYKNIALTKKSTLQVKIPQRKFMGGSPEIFNRIQTVLNNYLNRLQNTKK